MVPLTKDEFVSALPGNMKSRVSDALVLKVNTTLSDPEHYEVFRDNLVGYTNVLQMGRFKMDSYVNAVKYVSLKLLGFEHKQAYMQVFPDKYRDFVARGLKPKVIFSYISAYNTSKLVMLIYEQTLIPTYIVNAPLLQEAINVQAELMYSAKSEKVRSDAAACLIKELKAPEATKVELDIGQAKDDTIENYRTLMSDMVKIQQGLIKSGMDVKDVANAPVRLKPVNVVDI